MFSSLQRLSLLTFILPVAGCMAPMGQIEGGDLANNVYINRQYGFALHVPERWVLNEKTELENYCVYRIGNPLFAAHLLTCHPGSDPAKPVLCALFQEHGTPDGALTHAVTSTGDRITRTARTVRLEGQPFRHLQLRHEGKEESPLLIDLYATGIGESTLLIGYLHTQPQGRGQIDTLISTFFERL